MQTVTTVISPPTSSVQQKDVSPSGSASNSVGSTEVHVDRPFSPQERGRRPEKLKAKVLNAVGA